MSGSSLDGVDLVCCEFKLENNKWNYKVLDSYCYEYSKGWQKILANIGSLTAEQYIETDILLGAYYGDLINDFISNKTTSKSELIILHGHTAFHNPKNRYTAQIGSAAAVVAKTNISTVTNLRLLDICLGGQGAPIVPIGEHYLFKNHTAFLNIGGIANVSIHQSKDDIIAYDICPANTLLNYLASKLGATYDYEGNFAAHGEVNSPLLEQLNNCEYYNLSLPRTLSTEYIRDKFMPILEESNLSINNKLATVVEHISEQLYISLVNYPSVKSIFITGGGALNKFLIIRIKEKLKNIDVVIPDKETINYKEAIIIAFFGLLRFKKEINIFKSVTGATHNSIGGALYLNTN